MGKQVNDIVKMSNDSMKSFVGLNGIKKSIDPFGLVLKGGPQSAPAAQTPAVMPEPDDEAVQAARRRKAAAMAQRGGRASTILSGEEPLGGSR